MRTLTHTHTAQRAGRIRVSQVQGTINGVGERCGNADLVSVSACLALKSGGAYSVVRCKRRQSHLAAAVRCKAIDSIRWLGRFSNRSIHLDRSVMCMPDSPRGMMAPAVQE